MLKQRHAEKALGGKLCSWCLNMDNLNLVFKNLFQKSVLIMLRAKIYSPNFNLKNNPGPLCFRRLLSNGLSMRIGLNGWTVNFLLTKLLIIIGKCHFLKLWNLNQMPSKLTFFLSIIIGTKNFHSYFLCTKGFEPVIFFTEIYKCNFAFLKCFSYIYTWINRSISNENGLIESDK